MAALAIQDASTGLQSVTMASAASGDTIAGGSRAAGWDLGVFLLVLNTDAAAKTVTVNGVSYTVPLTSGVAVIPVYAGQYGVARTITYSATTGVKVAAVRLSPAP